MSAYSAAGAGSCIICVMGSFAGGRIRYRVGATLGRLFPIVLALWLGAVLLACGTIQGVKNIGVIREDVKAELGVDSGVNVGTFNGVMTITVSLASVPKGKPTDVKKKVEAIVRKRVPEVDNVVVRMQL